MSETTELPMLAGIGAILRWAEELITIGSGPMLTAGLGISLIDLLTDGQLLASAPALLYAWAISQALGVDGQLIGAAVKIGRAFRGHHPWHGVAYIPLIAALGYVAYLASNVFATQQALGISTQDALARLGMDSTSWIVARSLLAVVLVILSGLLRYEPTKATAIETAEERQEREARELQAARHKAELRAVKAAGMRQMTAAAMGRVTPLDTPPIDDANTPTLDASLAAVSSDDIPPDDGGNSGGNRRTSRRNTPGIRAVPSGMWKRDDLQRYARAKHGAIVSDDRASEAMSVLSKGRRVGRSYVAPKAAVKAWVDGAYTSGNRAGNAAAQSA
ncbi:MAG: hypothetical protein IVW57_00050 [Ktedonobacterales bacterium]|nr:hypothetical protein [Ktedonobacterales bacterium]